MHLVCTTSALIYYQSFTNGVHPMCTSSALCVTLSSVSTVAKSASRALGAIYSKFLCAGGMNISVYTKLVETKVELVLLFCSGIWGHTNFSEIESVLNKAGRYFLGVTKHCSNVSSRGDLGWNSCEVKQKVETVRLWCRLRNMPEHRIIRPVHEWSLPKSRTWE